jgi:hypothetical protein
MNRPSAVTDLKHSGLIQTNDVGRLQKSFGSKEERYRAVRELSGSVDVFITYRGCGQ